MKNTFRLLSILLLSLSLSACGHSHMTWHKATAGTGEMDVYGETTVYNLRTGEKAGTIASIGYPGGGVVFVANLHGVPPGFNGFHLHENPSCANNGKAAGGHYDPYGTGVHEGPDGNGHLGDLPMLYAFPDGRVQTAVLSIRLDLSDAQDNDLKGRSLVIHQGLDHYAGVGGNRSPGGARIMCGVIGETRLMSESKVERKAAKLLGKNY